jgi:excisionase family DNA binding protein
MTIKSSGLLDTQQVAEILGCTSQHVRNLIRGKVKGKKLPAFKVGQREYQVKREDVFQYLEKCRVEVESFYK